MSNERLYKVISGVETIRLSTFTKCLHLSTERHEELLDAWEYVIIAENCKLPDSDGGRSNDTIILETCNKHVYFIKREYLVPVDCISDCNYCPTCGTQIT